MGESIRVYGYLSTAWISRSLGRRIVNLYETSTAVSHENEFYAVTAVSGRVFSPVSSAA